MRAQPIPRDDGFYDLAYEGEIVAEGVSLHYAEQLAEFYDFCDQAITREFGERGE